MYIGCYASFDNENHQKVSPPACLFMCIDHLVIAYVLMPVDECLTKQAELRLLCNLIE